MCDKVTFLNFSCHFTEIKRLSETGNILEMDEIFLLVLTGGKNGQDSTGLLQNLAKYTFKNVLVFRRTLEDKSWIFTLHYIIHIQ